MCAREECDCFVGERVALKYFLFVIVTYLSLVDEADDSPLEFFGEFPAIKIQHEMN